MAAKKGTEKSDTPKKKRTRKSKATPEEQVVVEEVKEEVKVEEPKEKEISETEALKAQVEELKRLLAEQQSKPVQVVQIANDTERVQFLWQAEVADDNQVIFGDNGRYGKIVGKTGGFSVPKNDLSSVLDARTRQFIDMRWLIIVSGLNEEEREALNANYSEGEILDKKAFAKMVELGDKMLDIYPELCDEHKAMVAKRYYEAWKNKKGVRRELVVALNKLSPNDGFKAIIEEMNAKDAE